MQLQQGCSLTPRARGACYLLAALLCAYGRYAALDYVICGVFAALLVADFRRPQFNAYYFLLLFFEPVLQLPFGTGSMFRIYQAAFLVRFLFYGRKEFALTLRVSLAAALLLGVSSVLYAVNLFKVASALLNCGILYLIFREMAEREEGVTPLLFALSVGAAFSGVYTFLNESALSGAGFQRVAGVISDPNYAAYFYLMGLGALAVLRRAAPPAERCALLAVLLVALVRTVSLMGFLVFAACLFVYLLCTVRNKRWVLLFALAAIAALGAFLALPLGEGTALYGYQTRLRNMLLAIAQGRDFTSTRIFLWRDYLQSYARQGARVWLLGGQNVVEGAVRDQMVAAFGNVSHSSYIDMLYMIGAPGCLAVTALVVLSALRHLRLYRARRDDRALAVALIKLASVFCAMGLSLFPYRYFLAAIIMEVGLKHADRVAVQS